MISPSHPVTNRLFDDRFDIAYACGCIEFYDALVACPDHPAGPLVAEAVAPEPASKLVYVGRIMDILPIANADRLERAMVSCGSTGGLWWGVVAKGEFTFGELCNVYLADSVLPPTEQFEFMRKYKFRVRMQKLRGVPSEVLITRQTVGPATRHETGLVGVDVTAEAGVQKYEKPQPTGGSTGLRRKRYFPAFIPKTDEPNFQRARDLVDALRRVPCYITEKADGSSMTVYKHNGIFGVCSRNMELFPLESDSYWKIAARYRLAETLPEGVAIQGELVGPAVQGNPLGLEDLDIRVFNVYKIGTGYADYAEAITMARELGLPFVRVLAAGARLPEGDDYLRTLSEGQYPNGAAREGIVIRPMTEMDYCGERVSVKVINLNYKD